MDTYRDRPGVERGALGDAGVASSQRVPTPEQLLEQELVANRILDTEAAMNLMIV